MICPPRQIISGPVNEAAQHVEELHIDVDEFYYQLCTLSLGPLPCNQALWVLRVTNCVLLTVAPLSRGATFPQLSKLHLKFCGVSLVDLRGIADAAPCLAKFHLESPCIVSPYGETFHRCQLIFPAVTALVFSGCICQWENIHLLELDVPRMEFFKYEDCIQC